MREICASQRLQARQITAPITCASVRLQTIRVGQIEMLGQHLRPGREPVHQEGAEQDRHRGARRHAERNGRHQVTAFLGIVGALRRDHAAHVAGAEGFGILLGALRVAIGDPVDHRRADAGDRAKRRCRARRSAAPATSAAPTSRTPSHWLEKSRCRARCRRRCACATPPARRVRAARKCQASPESAARRPTDRASRRSSAACRSAPAIRSWRSSGRDRRRSAP